MREERRAAPADIDRLMEIRGAVRENRLSDPLSVTRADYERFVDAGRVWVCEVAGLIVGFSAGDERDGWIWALFVEEGHAGQGIGAALLQRACEDLKAVGHAAARLSTEPGTHADRLYRRLGWRDVGRAERGEVLFERSL